MGNPKGIVCGGNWIVDHVKIIDHYPKSGMLCNIESDRLGTGGCPYNVLINLAKMKCGLPLAGCGVIGNDSSGQFIQNDLDRHKIDRSQLFVSQEYPTSTTDVMTVRSTGERTFFHSRGANDLYNYEIIRRHPVMGKIFHLGYLLLLGGLDCEDETYGTMSARALCRLQQLGYKTSVDLVSVESDRYDRWVRPCLAYCDYLIINEIEASALSGIPLRSENGDLFKDNLDRVINVIFEMGVGYCVIIHMPEGGAGRFREKNSFVWANAFTISIDEIQGTVGAGDAFCAAALYGLHEDWPMRDILTFANANARFCLQSPTSTGGAQPLDAIKLFVTKKMPNIQP